MKCKLCGSEKIKKISIEDKYYYCENCELIFIDPNSFPSYKKELEVYEGHDNNHENEGYVRRFRNFINTLIVEHMEDIEDVLEFGCGPGPVLADMLEERGLNVVKYDPFFYSDVDYKNKEYDLITSTEVFEHFWEPKQEVEKLIELIKDKAYLAVMTSFHPGFEEFKDWWYRRDSTHVTFYNLNTFKYLESNYPLKIIKTNNKNGIIFQKE